MNKLIKVILVLIVSLLIASSPVFAGKLVIKGSTTVLPIAQKAAEAYMAENPNVKISLSGGGSGNGIKAIIDGTADIGNASRFIKQKEVDLASTKGVYPVPFRIALDAIVPVVNYKNIVSDLTMAQLKDIYLGKIKDWKELGGTPGKIVVISRDSSSGTFGVWKNIVMKKERVIPSALTEVSLMDEPASALDPIATQKIEELITELSSKLTIIIVTHNMQQAARVSDRTAFFYMGKLIEVNDTDTLFTKPRLKQTEDYITGRFG